VIRAIRLAGGRGGWDYASKEDPVWRTCQLPLHDGRVACPSKGDIDVERCYLCPRLRAFYDDESGTKVVCSAPRLGRERAVPGTTGARSARR
jgi:hypothetical protein